MSRSNLGVLYIVATPIGNLADITIRAQEVLKMVDYIAAEDTRHTRQLLNHLGILQKIISLHDYNEKERSLRLLTDLQQGQNIALVSDAGTPLISDPGFILVREVRAAGITVVPIPGACAAIVALCASGLPTDRFVFEGFLPAKKGLRLQRLQKLQDETRTLIFYESVHRILDMLMALITVFGENRLAVVARELTKRFETIQQGSLFELYTHLKNHSETQRGEFVVLVQGSSKQKESEKDVEITRILTILLRKMPTKQAADIAAEMCEVPRNQAYQLAIQLKKKYFKVT